jgi:hypothetical protein
MVKIFINVFQHLGGIQMGLLVKSEEEREENLPERVSKARESIRYPEITLLFSTLKRPAKKSIRSLSEMQIDDRSMIVDDPKSRGGEISFHIRYHDC